MVVKHVLSLVAALGCVAGALGATDAEASHGRRHRRSRCCEPPVACVPDCCVAEGRIEDEWVEWHPDGNGGHRHCCRAIVSDDGRREVVEVPMRRRATNEVVAVTSDCACRR